jgi:hypothetical protein
MRVASWRSRRATTEVTEMKMQERPNNLNNTVQPLAHVELKDLTAQDDCSETCSDQGSRSR